MRHVQPPLISAKDTTINAAAQIQTNTSLELQVITLFKASNVGLASYTLPMTCDAYGAFQRHFKLAWLG